MAISDDNHKCIEVPKGSRDKYVFVPLLHWMALLALIVLFLMDQFIYRIKQKSYALSFH